MRGRYDLPSARLRDAILPYQPTTYHPLDDGVGPLRDVSRGWSATVTGSPTFGVGAPGAIERGITFSGTGQYAVTSGSVPTPSASMTALAFARWTSATADLGVISRGTGAQGSWIIDINSTRCLAVVKNTAAGNHAFVYSAASGSLNDGLWHMVAMTFDGTTLRAYHFNTNGTSGTQSSTSLTGSWKKDSTGGIAIAAYDTAGFVPFNGTMAHGAYFNDRVLTASDFGFLASVAFG